jgi:hypothetical protein
MSRPRPRASVLSSDTAASTRRAWLAACCPASVNAVPRPGPRITSRTSSRRSNSATASDTADWDTWHSPAAAVMPPVSATATRYSSCRNETDDRFMS